MPRGRLLLLSVLAFGFSLAGGAHSALAAATVLRPTNGGTYAYGTPEAEPYVGANVVVHYVTTGPSAPPLNDDNGDGYPDYVEAVAGAADAALLYYQQHGFKAPLPDTAGVDPKPDIYIDALPPGTFGLTFGERTGEGGSFVLVSPRLDPSVPKAFGGLSTTVAHELFHVVQYSYVASGRLPRWAAEGSAVAMAMLVFPSIDDSVATGYLDQWLTTPWLPLDDERSGCARCYGGAWWWLYLESLKGAVLPRYFAKLESDDRSGKTSTLLGVTQLDSAVSASGNGSLASVFASFSVGLYRRGLPVGRALSLKASDSSRTTRVLGVFGLSTHYVSIAVPASSRGVVVAIPYGNGPAPSVTMIVGGPKGRRVVGKRVRPGKGVLLATTFRNAAERKHVLVVVTSGHLEGVQYQLGYAAVGPHGHLPGWIAF